MQENSFYDDEINEVFPTGEFEINVNHVNYLTYSQLNANNNKFSDIIDSLKVVGRPDGIKKISKIEDSEINQVEKILNKFELLDELSDDLKSEHKVALDYLNNVKVLKNKIQHELI
jgi:ABC-type antimicrobial peptide transport system permease subunit